MKNIIEKLHNKMKYAKNEQQQKEAAQEILEYSQNNSIPLMEANLKVVDIETEDDNETNFLNV